MLKEYDFKIKWNPDNLMIQIQHQIIQNDFEVPITKSFAKFFEEVFGLEGSEGSEWKVRKKKSAARKRLLSL